MKRENTEQIVRRLKSVEGHVRGVAKMVENGEYCIDVVHQILAVQKALQKINALVLDGHLHTCVSDALRGEDAEKRETVIQEIMNVFQARER